MSDVQTQVKLPSELFWKVARIAESADMRVDQYLAELAFQATVRPHTTEVEAVAARWSRGMTDKEIARDLEWTNLQVATRRRSLGLAANKRKREAS